MASAGSILRRPASVTKPDRSDWAEKSPGRPACRHRLFTILRTAVGSSGSSSTCRRCAASRGPAPDDRARAPEDRPRLAQYRQPDARALVRVARTTAGGGANPSPNLAAGNDADGVPVSVRNATRLLWETARREAEEVQRGELESVRSELQERGNALVEAQSALAQREEAFADARVSLDSALASSQQARETLDQQLKEHALEAHRVRIGLEDDVKRLTALLSQACDAEAVLRAEAEGDAATEGAARTVARGGGGVLRGEQVDVALRVQADVARLQLGAGHVDVGLARRDLDVAGLDVGAALAGIALRARRALVAALLAHAHAEGRAGKVANQMGFSPSSNVTTDPSSK
jgi:hypothetical protein